MIGALAPLLLGLGLAALLAPRGRAGVLLGLGASVPLGLLATSALRFVWLVALGPASSGAFTGLLLALALVLGAVAWRTRKGEPVPVSPAAPRPPAWQLALGAAAAAAAIGAFLVFARNHPHGRWDAWMIWNLRARFVLRAGDEWAQAFSPRLSWSHPDYPPGLSLSVEWLWRALGTESDAAPTALALAYLLGLAAMLGAAAWRARGPRAAVVAVALLLGTFEAVKLAASQYADIPIACAFLGGAVALGLREREADPAQVRRWLLLGGAMLGAAAWTKNEGLLYALALPAALALTGRARGPRALAREVGLVLLGAAPALLALALFKARLAPANDIVAGQGLGATLGRVVQPGRWGEIVVSVAREGVKLPVWLLAPYLALVGLAPGARGDRSLALGGALLLLLFAGYVAVYVVTPLPLDWHLNTSMRRLLLHLWPIVVWCGVLAARTGDEVEEAPHAAPRHPADAAPG